MPAPDWTRALAIGTARQQMVESRPGGTTERINPRDLTENAIGWLAEAAFAQFFGYPVRPFTTAGGGDDGFDFDTPIGRVDVKGSKFKPYFMPVKNSVLVKAPGPDAFVHVYCPVSHPVVYCVGWIAKADVLPLPSWPNCYEPPPIVPKGLVIPGRVVRFPLPHTGQSLLEVM